MHSFRNYFSFLLFIFSGYSYTVSSQTEAYFGLKAGGGLSTYYFFADRQIVDLNMKGDFVPVYAGGITFHYKNATNPGVQMGLQIEAQHVIKSWQHEIAQDTVNTVNFHCAELSALAQMHIKIKSTTLLVNAGPYGSYAYEKKDDLVPNLDYSDLPIDYNNLEAKFFDYGIKAGLGYDLWLGKNKVQFQVMYSQSMQNLLETDFSNIYFSLHQSLFLSVIYKIPLIKQPTIPIEDKE